LVTEPFAVNKFAQASEALVAKFAEKWDIKILGFDDFNTVFAFLFADTSLERLVVVGNLNCLLFYIDDMAIKAKLARASRLLDANYATLSAEFESIHPLIEVFRAGILPQNPTKLQLAFEDLRRQFLDLSSNNREWLGRLATSLERYFTKTNRPADLLGPLATLDLDAYIAWREDDSGMYTCIDTIEFTQDLYLPPQILHNPVLHRMQRDCVQIVALMNDLFSYHKEITKEDYHYHLVNIFREKYGLPLDEAIQDSIRVINRIILDFYEMEKCLPDLGKTANKIIQRHVQGLKYQIGTAWHWQLMTGRYKAVDSPISELKIREYSNLNNPTTVNSAADWS
jgi:hypothetical protein